MEDAICALTWNSGHEFEGTQDADRPQRSQIDPQVNVFTGDQGDQAVCVCGEQMLFDFNDSPRTFGQT